MQSNRFVYCIGKRGVFVRVEVKKLKIDVREWEKKKLFPGWGSISMVKNCDRGFKNAARRRKFYLKFHWKQTNFTRLNYFVIFRNNFKCKVIVSFVEFTPNFAQLILC